MIKDELIIINAFPKDEIKIKMLERQLSYLKQLNLPILIISGCTVPEHIINQVDYVIINTENELLDRDWTHKIVNSGFKTYVFDSMETDNLWAKFYWPNVNSTITKNIQLAFKTAYFLGYKTVFYTEDDNIWKEESFDYINENINVLKSNQYKLATVLGIQLPADYFIFFTTFFFANVEFMFNNFTLPNSKEEWYDLETIKKYNLNKTYEGCFYDLFKDNLDLIYNSHDSFLHHQKKGDIEWGIYDRRHSERNLINTFFTVLVTPNKEKILFLYNQTNYLKEGSKTYNVSVNFDDTLIEQTTIYPDTFYYILVPNHIDKIKLDIENYGEKIIDCSLDKVISNGEIINKITQNPPYNFLIGGRMGDFIQVLYVAYQYYQQTNIKSNIYVTNDLVYGGDKFHKPIEQLYKEFFPVLEQQEYINSFEIFNNQTKDFINLNEKWRVIDFHKDKWPWINLFNQSYLTEFTDFKYGPWVKIIGSKEEFKNKVIIHRAYYRTTNSINWKYLIKNNDCVFVGFEDTQYNKFPYKHMLPFYQMEDLEEFCLILNSCKFYVGNQTGPLSIAHAMDVPRLAELCDADAVHYVGEEKFMPKLNWISNQHTFNYLDTIYDHINYQER